MAATKKASSKRSFHQELVLNRWLLGFFQGGSLTALKQRLMQDEHEGIAEDGQTGFFHALMQNLFEVDRISQAELRRHDLNIVRYWQTITERRNQREGHVLHMKYFQYLSLLFTEIYLDWFFNRQPELLAELNTAMASYKAEPGAEPFRDFAPDDLNKIAFWNATGSGKTLLLHVNLLQYLHHFERRHPGQHPSKIILLTPNEGLSRQHLDELHLSGFSYARYFDKNQSGSFRGTVEIIDINKLGDEMGDKTVAVDAFEGNNLVLIDEGHRGAGAGAGVWMQRREALVSSGFAFEYSATFGQAVAKGQTVEQAEEDIRKKRAKMLFDTSSLKKLDEQQLQQLKLTDSDKQRARLQATRDNCVRCEIVGYFSANLRLAPDWSSATVTTLPDLQAKRATAVSADDLYRQQWMFHGPAYQGVKQFKGIGSNGIDGELRVPTGRGALLDNMGQLAGYWVMEQPENCLAMPIGVNSIRFYGPDPEPEQVLQAQVRISSIDSLNCITQHQLTAPDGRLLISIDGWQTRRYQMDKPFWEASRLLSEHVVSRVIAPDAVLFEDRYDTAILRDYLSRRYLTACERECYDALSPRRKRSWLNGRIAAKDAVRVWLKTRGMRSVYPQEIRIENDALGAPKLYANVTTTLPAGLFVSISHKGNLATAIVANEPVGIDVETIAAHDSDFMAMAFTPAERVLLTELAGDPVELATRAWVAKEVAAKRAGCGLKGEPHSWVISAHCGRAFKVNDCWVYSQEIKGHVLGWSLPQALAEELVLSLLGTPEMAS